ncbi:Ribonuclease VapC [Gammaproteobacteria bacterium]
MSAEFIDANIFIYSIAKDDIKRRRSLSILARKPVLSLQVLSEASNVMRKKLRIEISEIQIIIIKLIRESQIHPTTLSTLMMAFTIAERYGFSHYDSMIIAAAMEANCTTLYSEDMQHGQVINQQLSIINPFVTT